MKKTAWQLLIFVIVLIFSGCSQLPEHNVPDQHETSDAQSFIRKVEFPIHPEIEQYLNPDNSYIACIDELYIAAKNAFESMTFDESIYNAALTLAEKQNSIFATLLEDCDDDFRQWYLMRAFDGTLGVDEIVIADYENTTGTISDETALVKELRAADIVLNFYYADYIPIFVLPEYSSADIINAFNNNELAADKTFCNRLIIVNGYVQDTTKDVYDQYYVSLHGYSEHGDALRCYFDKSFEEAIVALSKGDFVSFVVSINGKDTFDINATLCDISTSENQDGTVLPFSDGSANNSLFGTLDLSKVWKIPFTSEDYNGAFHYAFFPDNTCYLVLSDGSNPWHGGKGTYQTSDSSIAFDIVMEGCRFTYGYDYDLATNQLTHTYGTPIMAELAEPGSKYYIEEDFANDITKIKDLAQDFFDNLPDNSGV